MAITKDEYCIKVCGGKCCKYLNPESPCPNLRYDNRCGVYDVRYAPNAPEFEIVGWYKVKDAKGLPIIKPFICGQIEKIIERGELPNEIKDQCIYAHPELGDLEYGSESTDQK